MVLFLVVNCTLNEDLIVKNVDDQATFLEKSIDQDSLLMRLDKLSKAYRQPALKDLFNGEPAAITKEDSSTLNRGFKEVNKIATIGYESYIADQVVQERMTSVDGDYLLYEIEELFKLLAQRTSFSFLVEYAEERIKYYQNLSVPIEDVISTYQLLLFSRDIFAGFSTSKGFSGFTKVEGRYCEVGGWFCYLNNNPNIPGIGQASVGILGGVGATINFILLPAGAVTVGTALITAAPFFLTIAIVGFATCTPPECDDCHEARGIVSLVGEDGPCAWGDFLAYGGSNTFEEVMSFNWRFSFPSTSENILLTTTDRVVPKAQLQNQLDANPEFTVAVDVMCDEEMLFEWIGEPKVFNIYEHQVRAVPSINLPTADQFYYPSGSEICFQLSSSPVWIPVQWQATEGTVSSGQGWNFCTSFIGSSTFGLSCTIQNRCNGEQRTIYASLLVLDI